MNTATELSRPGLSPTVPMPRRRAVALASDPVDDTISDGASCAIWRISVAPEFWSAAVLTCVGSADVFDLIQIGAVAFRLHRIAGHEAQRSGVDAIAQPAAIARTVGEDMAQVAVAMLRTHFGAHHAVAAIVQFLDIGGLDRLGEARPTTMRFIFVGRGEQRFARDDIDVDARGLVAEIFARTGAFCPAFLRHIILFGPKRRLSVGGREATVDGQVHTGNIVRILARQKGDGPGDVGRLRAAADRDALLEFRDEVGLVLHAFGQRGIGERRVDRIHAHAGLRFVHRQCTGEVGDRTLGRAIEAVVPVAAKTRHRRDVDDAALGRAQMRDRGAAHLDDAVQVGFDHLGKGAEIAFVELAEMIDTGVVDQHVDAVEAADGKVDQRLAIGHATDVHLQRLDCIAQLRGEALEARRVLVA
ncbi:hypothetical protein WR25_25867 [Diploscapter pachys]|uniref:Uncharacterized protein n=1 Tax=Diploscapter pachys TaxID=2018661 RepID=A0A2A2M257_9BILA|nr:hypothetical protein WR25_25867 [Diploscapter pachys]